MLFRLVAGVDGALGLLSAPTVIVSCYGIAADVAVSRLPAANDHDR